MQIKSKRLLERVERQLSSKIDYNVYLSNHPDVRASGMEPFHHYIRYGWKENRQLSIHSNGFDFLVDNPELAKQILILNNPNSISDLDEYFLHQKRLRKNTDLLLRNSCMNSNILFVGYVEAALGLGDAARATALCYSHISDDFAIYPYNFGAENRYVGEFMPWKYETSIKHRINVIEVGLDNIEKAFNEINNIGGGQSYNILKLYWELSEIPSETIDALNLYDEIWVPSKFVYDAVVKVFQKRVVVIPPYVDVEITRKYTRRYFRLAKNKYYFLFSFDYNSSVHRKNPVAVINAFKDAFPISDRSVGLIMKSNNPRLLDIDQTSVRNSNSGDDRIVFIEEYLDRQKMLSLIDCCDCYVSLHRAEGFGLGMAEAIALGKKVVATAYSGNVDFMNKSNSYPVDFDIVQVPDSHYYLSAGRVWAEPMHSSAVANLQKAVKDNKSWVLKTIEFCKYSKLNKLDRNHIGNLMKQRIDEILKIRS